MDEVSFLDFVAETFGFGAAVNETTGHLSTATAMARLSGAAAATEVAFSKSPDDAAKAVVSITVGYAAGAVAGALTAPAIPAYAVGFGASLAAGAVYQAFNDLPEDGGVNGANQVSIYYGSATVPAITLEETNNGQGYTITVGDEFNQLDQLAEIGRTAPSAITHNGEYDAPLFSMLSDRKRSQGRGSGKVKNLATIEFELKGSGLASRHLAEPCLQIH